MLGTINPVREIGRLAHAAGALFLVDGAPDTVRASVYLYNTFEEIDYFLQTLQETIAHKLLAVV